MMPDWKEQEDRLKQKMDTTSKKSAVEGRVSLRDYLMNYAEAKEKQAKGLGNLSKYQGNIEEATAWYHTAMAYSDIMNEIKKVS
ncbi:hypothetical protein KAR91_83880 [Candidatus Pacearchaeota archaeon]|nr:hypothetical protein [Candidatus Pacearchaeota archaeon]